MAKTRNALVLTAMCLATFMAILDTSLVNLGLKSIQQAFRVDTAALQWVIDLYTLTYAVFILTGGTLADLYGRRLIFIAGVVVFAIGTLLCAVAPNIAVLILGRGIAGLGAALELPVALAILNVTYSESHERARAIAIWGGMNGLATAIGPSLGGLLVDAFGWRSLFYAVLPVAVATAGMAFAWVPESSDPKGRGLDLAGQVFAVFSLAALCVGFIEGPKWDWQSGPVFTCFALFGLAGCTFLLTERTSPRPLLPLRVFRNRALSAAIADASLMTFGIYGMLFVLPLFFQAVRGEAATRAGIELLPMSITFFLISWLAGPAVNSVGPRVVISFGMTLTGAGLFVLASITEHSSYAIIAAGLITVGVGLGLITGPIATVAVANAPATRSGMSSGLVNVGRMIGATIGVAILGILFGPRIEETAQNATQFVGALHVAFLIGGSAQLLGALIALACVRRDSAQTRTASREAPRRGPKVLAQR
jgi:MFS transporter, DHA2 family, methylenomycin A resistance protein